ncbi:uncharacterized protein L3040_005915 [Drepanopeziza brunnea f. sp. 'multigermtubi']|uniref:uncharacterized protein n=1 Tax=Drepanopeziza brunnea f. sp. 'multigermtubi' TaxID=698441 RepID=UPI00238F6ED8|nr:hypothetical protein L3040_005915 [Drepanopeziza brunnea f. sp. 'multigermtubi']
MQLEVERTGRSISKTPNTLVHKTKIFNGGWTRTQVVAYLLASHDLAAAQQHLKKGPIEMYPSDRVADISLTQWLALTPPDTVSNTLKVPRSVVDQLKKEK